MKEVVGGREKTACKLTSDSQCQVPTLKPYVTSWLIWWVWNPYSNNRVTLRLLFAYASSRPDMTTPVGHQSAVVLPITWPFPIKINERNNNNNNNNICNDVRMFMKAFPHPLSFYSPSWFIVILSLPFLFLFLAIFYCSLFSLYCFILCFHVYIISSVISFLFLFYRTSEPRG